MNVKRGILLVLACLWAGGAAARLDEVEQRMRAAYTQDLRWDNVEGRPEWLDGVEPVYANDWAMHRLTLAPGRSSVIRVPATALVRLYAPDRRLEPDDVEVLLSDGSGLAANMTPVPSADGHSLVVQAPADSPSLAVVRRPQQAAAPLNVAVFVSRREVLPSLAPYRDVVGLEGMGVLLQRGNQPEVQRYWPLTANQPVTVELQGPARHMLVQRLRCGSEIPDLHEEYRIRSRVDEGDARWLDYASTVETTYPTYVNGTAASLGQEERSFIDVPAGHHRVEIMSDRDLYARLQRQNNPDYLLPGLNEPRLTAAQARETMPADGLEALEKNAERAARDNAQRDGGLAAVAAMEQAADAHPEYPPARQKAERLRDTHGFYRDLLPAESSAAGHALAWFLPPRLLELGEETPRPPATEALEDALFTRMHSGRFTLLPGERPLLYPVPTREAPSRLHVAVERPAAPAAFWLQMDDEPPRRLETLPRPEGLNDGDFAPAPTEAALALLAERHGTGPAPTLDGAFATRREPAPFIEAAEVELPLPRRVTSIRIWQASGPPLKVALRYRSSRLAAAGEGAYRALLNEAGGDAAFDAFIELLSRPRAAPDAAPLEALRNDWLPIVRQIRAEGAVYAAAVTAPGVECSTTASAAAEASEQARRAEQRQDWLTALEYWAPATCTGGTEGEQARLAQANALQKLGEDDLAEALRRQLALYGHLTATREAAAQRLEQRYRQRGDLDTLRALAAARMQRFPDRQRLASLVQAMAESGQNVAALKLALLVPEKEQPRALLVPAALAENWGDSLKQWLAAEPKEVQALWQGWQVEHAGDVAAAQATWQNAGPTAEPWRQALATGQSLRARREVGNPDAAAWQGWWQTLPGPWQWQDGSHWLQADVGTETYYSLERDVYGHAYRAEPDRPLRMGVAGPTRLRLRVRPLHDAASHTGVDGWLEIRDGAALTVWPITHNRPAAGLSLGDGVARRPGREFTVDYAVKPGWHDITLFAGTTPVGVQVDEWRPLLPLSVLPPLRPSTWQVSDGGSSFAGWAALPQERDPQGNPREHQLFRNHQRLAESQDNGLRDALGTAEMADVLAAALGKGDYAAILNLPEADAAQAPVRMAAYAWIVEHDAALGQRALAQAESLWQRFTEQPEVNDLWQRLKRHSHWEPVADVDRSAGLRTVSETGWQPSEPSLRVRRALMEAVGANEYILTDDRPLVLYMRNSEPTTIDLSVRQADVPLLPPMPLEAAYQLDEQPLQTVAIDRGAAWKTLSVAIPEGEHELRLQRVNPLADQYLRLRLTEHGQPLVQPMEQTYQVTAPGAPLRMQAQGPAWLRVDRLASSNRSTDYRLLTSGWQKVAVSSQSGAEELLRVQTRQRDDALRPLQTRDVERMLETVPATELQVQDVEPPAQVRLEDAYVLGKQEDGTWSIGVDAVRRTNFTEDVSQKVPEEFIEYHASHRYHHATEDAYFLTRFLARQREHGGPTFGVKHETQFQPWDNFLIARLEGGLFAQVPDERVEWSGFLKGSLTAPISLSPKTVLLPSFSMFGRHLSLRQGRDLFRSGSGYPLMLDQDVYTRYKDQHRAGSIFSLELQHRPWMDTLWYVNGGTTSNENMDLTNPDHLSFQVGWSQLFGPVVADFNYARRYFQKDDDRSQANRRELVNFGLSWNLWQTGQNRIELGAHYTHDFSRDADLGMLSITWHGGEGRGLRDFRDGELVFGDLLRRDQPHDKTNHVLQLPGH